VSTEIANAALRMSFGALSTDADVDRVSELFPTLVEKARRLATA
jgi:cysteine sulfinate desulfinase/cysteine desulfurase-like protein